MEDGDAGDAMAVVSLGEEVQGGDWGVDGDEAFRPGVRCLRAKLEHRAEVGGEGRSREIFVRYQVLGAV